MSLELTYDTIILRYNMTYYFTQRGKHVFPASLKVPDTFSLFVTQTAPRPRDLPETFLSLCGFEPGSRTKGLWIHGLSRKNRIIFYLKKCITWHFISLKFGVYEIYYKQE